MDELATLVGTGATTLVTAMTTSAWEGARAGLVRLFRRDGDDRGKTAEIQLDRNAELLGRVDDPDRVREGLTLVWASELEQLLRQYPDAEPELRALVQSIQAALGDAPQGQTQNITAYGGWAIGVQSGNVHIHEADSLPGAPKSAVTPSAGTSADD